MWFRNRWKFRFYKFFLTLVEEEVYPRFEQVGEKELWYYPCIGNKRCDNYEFEKNTDAWMTLSVLGSVYNSWCRLLRNLYKWPPSVIEYMPISRILNIIEQSIEDNKEGRIKEDFE